MTVTAAQFRKDMPEFADSAVFLDAVITMWLGVAAKMINTARWDTLADWAVEQIAAHNVALEREAMKAAGLGGIPGKASGAINNKSVDKVSVGYDTQAAAEEGAGYWNLTIYGQRYYRQAKLMGAGGLQLGVPGNDYGGTGAWSGPWPWNFPSMNL